MVDENTTTSEQQGIKRKPGHPWPKGVSGNPGGRPKKSTSLTALLKTEITKIPAGEQKGRTWLQLLVLAWLTGAMKNPVLLKELIERTDGKVPQPVTGEGGGPIAIKASISVVSDTAKAMLNDVLAGKGTEVKADGEKPPVAP